MNRQHADHATSVYGAGILLNHLQALQKEMEGVRQAKDIEYVHRMRVASRRLRSDLELFGDCLPAKKFIHWENQVKTITCALGAARDTDVQIELITQLDLNLEDVRNRPGLHRLRLRLQQRRGKLQAKVQTTLDAFEDSQTMVDMECRLQPIAAMREQVYLYTPALYQRGFNAITSHLNEFLALESCLEQPEKIAELHAMRIAAKKLRYILEAFAPLYEGELKQTLQAMRQIQDELGEIHDCDVWSDFLPGFIEKESQRTLAYFGHTRSMRRLEPGLLYFLHNRQENRITRFGGFVSYWQELKDQRLWLELRKLIQVPFDIGEARDKVEQNATAQPTSIVGANVSE
jgi:CHAD domain-containing protein